MNEIKMVPIVAGCVLVRDGKILLVQEKQPKVYGQWNLPAGRVDVGETIEQAAVREVLEETGFQVSLGKKLAVQHFSAERPVMHGFAATITGGELQIPEDELIGADWFTFDQILALQKAGKLRSEWIPLAVKEAL